MFFVLKNMSKFNVKHSVFMQRVAASAAVSVMEPFFPGVLCSAAVD